MSTMTYKGYSARVDFDERDGVFVGHVLGVRDTISFHGNTVAKLRADFHNAVDHYLAVCAKQGQRPEKPYSGKLMLRVSPEVHAAAAIAAEEPARALTSGRRKRCARRRAPDPIDQRFQKCCSFSHCGLDSIERDFVPARSRAR